MGALEDHDKHPFPSSVMGGGSSSDPLPSEQETPPVMETVEVPSERCFIKQLLLKISNIQSVLQIFLAKVP